MTQRKLSFATFSDAIAEAERLLQSGYVTQGNWNLAQNLGHCSDWLRFPIDGYPQPGFPINVMLWIMKVTVGYSARKRILKERKFKPGTPTMRETVKAVDILSDEAALEQFRTIVDRFVSYKEPMHASTLFGQMTNEEHMQMQLVHLEHHLGFLTPKNI